MKKAFFMGALMLIAAYGLFEARRLIGGPSIVLDSPQDGRATADTTVVVSGIAKNISFLTINDAPVFTDESGRFSERLSPPSGYAIFSVAGIDRFGRHITKQVHITVLNYCPVSASIGSLTFNSKRA